MCGLSGINSFDEVMIKRMNAIIAYRGPDATGVYLDKANGISLGHNRLAVIDLSEAANQPMLSDDGKTVIVYSGEIYNLYSLRDELQGKGYRFKTNSDTEVILNSWREWKESCAERFDGMWAFVIYDRENSILFLSRDRLGKKPLYYYYDGKTFVFSSEIKSIISAGVSPELNPLVIDYILNFRYFDEETPYLNIKMLPPGSNAIFDARKCSLSIKKYFRASQLIEKNYYDHLVTLPARKVLAEFEEIFMKAIEKRLISDVPLGVICSGGIDSSLVSACANKIQKLSLLHIDVTGYSELKYARLLAERLGTNIICQEFAQREYDEVFNDTLYHWEYPLIHPNSTGITCVARLARDKGIKVILGGEGADELFGGYPHQHYYYKVSAIKKYIPIPKKLRAIIRKADLLDGYFKGDSKLPTLQHIRGKTRFDLYYNKYDHIWSEHERRVQASLAADLNEYIMPLLLRGDKLSMAAGVEMRLPFLDIGMVRFALNLPLKYKISFTETKKIVRRFASRYLPAAIINRKKVGFNVPYKIKGAEELRFDVLKRYGLDEDTIKAILNLGKADITAAIVSLEKITELLTKERIMEGVRAD